MIRPLMKRLHEPIYTSRLRVLTEAIVPHLRADDAVLDVGCGFGELGRSILDHPQRPQGVNVKGLETHRRSPELIDVVGYDGGQAPFDNNTFDVVIIADVLHHIDDPDAAIAECVRLSRRLVIIKDHQISGPLAQARVSLIDWAANAPYGVQCLYRYHSPDEWAAVRNRHGLTVVEERAAMNLYPPVVNLLFGRSLQYFTAVRVPDAPSTPPEGES